MGTGVGQLRSLAYHRDVDDPVHQSLGWCLWEVQVTPSHPFQGYEKGIGGTPWSWLTARLGVGVSKKKKSSPANGLNDSLISMGESVIGFLDNGVNGT